MNGRTTFVVAGLVILYVCSWTFSLARLFQMHFWDREYVIQNVFGIDATTSQSSLNMEEDPMWNSSAAAAQDDASTEEENLLGNSFYSKRRYIYYLPHILGAVFWWNLYFFQLIPAIRHRFKNFHRMLGRCLMVAALAQSLSGIALSITSGSNIIMFSSCCLGVSVIYCLYHAYSFARRRDIPKHKYWVLRMVGYLQSIALQRFWFFVILNFTYQLDWHGLYPKATTEEEGNQVFSSMLDDSFVLSIFSAFLLTEWYLAGEQGMMEKNGVSSNTNRESSNVQEHLPETNFVAGEQKPLIEKK